MRKESEDRLREKLTAQRKELMQLRTSKVSSAPQVKLARIKSVRKGIAKILTVVAEKRIAEARTTFKHKRMPKSLRLKKTRAFRRRLTPSEASRMTLKQQKKHDNFKLRKYALAA